MQRVAVYFEIPVTDLDRAVRFYEAVFEVSLERAELDGNTMAFFPPTGEGGGITGSLACGESYVPGKSGTRIYFATSDILQTLSRAERAGGKTLYPRTAVPPYGWVAEFEDSEGNCIALSET
jgi:predicted enzyme related to lactoylglutathione lyase